MIESATHSNGTEQAIFVREKIDPYTPVLVQKPFERWMLRTGWSPSSVESFAECSGCFHLRGKRRVETPEVQKMLLRGQAVHDAIARMHDVSGTVRFNQPDEAFTYLSTEWADDLAAQIAQTKTPGKNQINLHQFVSTMDDTTRELLEKYVGRYIQYRVANPQKVTVEETIGFELDVYGKLPEPLVMYATLDQFDQDAITELKSSVDTSTQGKISHAIELGVQALAHRAWNATYSQYRPTAPAEMRLLDLRANSMHIFSDYDLNRFTEGMVYMYHAFQKGHKQYNGAHDPHDGRITKGGTMSFMDGFEPHVLSSATDEQIRWYEKGNAMFKKFAHDAVWITLPLQRVHQTMPKTHVSNYHYATS